MRIVDNKLKKCKSYIGIFDKQTNKNMEGFTVSIDNRFFRVVSCRVICDQFFSESGEVILQSNVATIRLVVHTHGGDESIIEAEEGEGPVNVLDKVLRKAIARFFPEVQGVRISDFKVGKESGDGSRAKVRVEIEFSDGSGKWWTAKGVSENIIGASLIAIAIGLEEEIKMIFP